MVKCDAMLTFDQQKMQELRPEYCFEDVKLIKTKDIWEGVQVHHSPFVKSDRTLAIFSLGRRRRERTPDQGNPHTFLYDLQQRQLTYCAQCEIQQPHMSIMDILLPLISPWKRERTRRLTIQPAVVQRQRLSR
jgi:hypothetical protein